MAKKPTLESVDPSKGGIATGGPPPTTAAGPKPVNPVDPNTGASPEQAPKPTAKKRGRPPKAAAFELDPATVEPMCSWSFNFMAARWGSHWKLTTTESRLLAEALIPVANKYLPTILERFGEEITLAFVLVGIVGSKAAQGFEKKLPVPPREGGTDGAQK